MRINTQRLTFEQNKKLYLSLREQYISGKPMTNGEERTMWSCWSYLTSNGFNWFNVFIVFIILFLIIVQI